MKITITKDTKGWDKLKKNLLQLDKNELHVGWFDTSYGSENDNLAHAQVAQWNEEGTSTSPPRPFMRSGFNDAIKSGSNDQDFRNIINAVLSGKSSLVALKASGSAFAATLKETMRQWSSPPNAPSTVAQKGFNDPLNETGELINNVSFEVGRK